jgi:hypothetical protein
MQQDPKTEKILSSGEDNRRGGRMKFSRALLFAFAVCGGLVAAHTDAAEKTAPVSDGVTLAVNATNVQMVAEMRTAVAAINKRYGAPPFAFMFSSDPVAGEKVAKAVAEINALKVTKTQLEKERDQVLGEIAKLRAELEKTAKNAEGEFARAEATRKTLDKATTLLRLEYRELQKLQSLKERLEGEVADLAVRAEQMRILGAGIQPRTVTPAPRATYHPQSGQRIGGERNIPVN